MTVLVGVSSRREVQEFLASSGTAVTALSRGYMLDMLDTVRQGFDKRVHNKAFLFFRLHVLDEGTLETRAGVTRNVMRVPIGCVVNMQIRDLKTVLLSIVDCANSQPRRIKLKQDAGGIIGQTHSLNQHHLPWDYAHPILSQLVPEYVRDGYLFSLAIRDDVPHLYLEGRINALTAADSS